MNPWQHKTLIQCVFGFLLLLCSHLWAGPVSNNYRDISETTKVQRDSLFADSLKKSVIFDSLKKMQSEYNLQFENASTTADTSPYSPHTPSPLIFAIHGSGLADLLKENPFFVDVPFSLSSRFNRSLPYGYSSIDYPLSSWSGIHTAPLNWFHSTNDIPLRIITTTTATSNAGLLYTRFDLGQTSPAMNLFWETGPFSENILSVDLSRPITHNALIKAYSDFRSLPTTSFDHGSGNIASFYQSLTNDTTYVMNKGYNPYTLEQRSGIACVIKSNSVLLDLHYQYSDTKNDLLLPDSNNLSFKRVAQFENLASAEMLQKGKLISLNAAVDVASTASQIAVQTDFNSAQKPKLHASGTTIGGLISPFLPLGDDTLKILLNAKNHSTLNFTSQASKLLYLNGLVGYTHTYNFLKFCNGSLNALAGVTSSQSDIEVIIRPTLSCELTAKKGASSLDIFGNLKAYEKPQAYDSINSNANALASNTLFYGLKYSHYFLSGFFAASYTRLSSIDSTYTKALWPGAIAPYENPQSVVTLAAQSPKLYGLRVNGKFSLADKMPYCKSTTSISYQNCFFNGAQAIDADLALSYWSKRTSNTIGLLENKRFWEHEIFDLSLTIGVQIKSFRLFYKAENLLNRKFAYVPGYIMPGLVFRWGFSWIIL